MESDTDGHSYAPSLHWLSWSQHRTKLGDPLCSARKTGFARSPRTRSWSTRRQGARHCFVGKLRECSRTPPDCLPHTLAGAESNSEHPPALQDAPPGQVSLWKKSGRGPTNLQCLQSRRKISLT